jgi:uncharacterized protein (DUF305 family)
MATIYDFKSRKIRASSLEQADPVPARVPNASDKKRPVDKETYLLWMFSKDIDAVLSKYMLEHHLKATELAAILSHRLGGLVATTEHPEKLSEFCENVMRRMAQVEAEQLGSRHPSEERDEPAADDQGAS